MKDSTQLADVLGVEAIGRMMEAVSKQMSDLQKDEAYKALSAEEQAARQDELVSRMLNSFMDKKRTHVHYNQLGYWADKLIGGAVTVGVAVAVGAVAMKVVGKPAETVVGETSEHNVETQAPLFNTGFDKASERPIRSSRELKAAV